MNFNKVILIGRIANEIDCRILEESKSSLARFVLAVNRRIRNSSSGINETTSFIPIVAWRQNADFVSKYLSKGSLVSVEGYVNVSRYTAKTTGSIVERFEVVAEGLESLETRSTNENRRSSIQDSRGGTRQTDFGIQRIADANRDQSGVTNEIPVSQEKVEYLDPEELIKNVSRNEEETLEDDKMIGKDDQQADPNLISEDVLNSDPNKEIFDDRVSQI